MSVSEKIQIQLQINAMSEIPFHIYQDDFTFIVNNQEFKTNKIIADLFSPKICKNHIADPTLDTFVINTSHEGQFSYILQLFNFTIQSIPDQETSFISEVLQILDNKNFQVFVPLSMDELTLKNVIEIIRRHEKESYFYSKSLQNEIDFISSHFFELSEAEEKNISELELETIERILNNENLWLQDENQLISFVNKLYVQDRKYLQLYEHVLFSFVSETSINEFIDVFDFNDINHQIWYNVSERLKGKIELNINDKCFKARYKKGRTFFDKEDKFDGVINYLKQNLEYSINELIDIESSSVFNSSTEPNNVYLFDNSKKYFKTNNEENSWICFDFKNNRIIPTSYVIKSYNFGEDSYHPKSWVIEGSNDNKYFEIIDEVNDCPYLKGAMHVHTFKISCKISKEFRYIRMRQTSNNCCESNTHYHLAFDSIEFYGTLIYQ